jgi:hypothetical protein
MATFWRNSITDGKISPVWCGGGGGRPPNFTISTITSKVVIYAPAEREVHSSYFYTLPLYVQYYSIWKEYRIAMEKTQVTSVLYIYHLR